VHALLGCPQERQPRALEHDLRAHVKKLWHMIQTCAMDKKHDLSRRWQWNDLAVPTLRMAMETDLTKNLHRQQSRISVNRNMAKTVALIFQPYTTNLE
jgi:hypothetical protein